MGILETIAQRAQQESLMQSKDDLLHAAQTAANRRTPRIEINGRAGQADDQKLTSQPARKAQPSFATESGVKQPCHRKPKTAEVDPTATLAGLKCRSAQ
jgi:hypothetical protein